MQKPLRIVVAALSLSAAGFGAIVIDEGFTEGAIIPVAGDRPTFGFGATFKEDGTPVKPGDRITAPKAVRLAISHIAKDETQIKQCVKAPLNQGEYDLMVDFSYQYGTNALCKSSMVTFANAGRYTESCEAYTLYKRVAGRDCSIRSNGCWGVWTRSLERSKKCLELQ